MSEGTNHIETSLAWLLHPITVEAFTGEIWAEKRCHISRQRPGYFDGLFPERSAAEALLGLFRSEPSRVRLLREHDKKTPDDYLSAGGALDLTRVDEHFDAGFTIVLEDVELFVRSIASLARAIEAELNFATKVNAYVTPPKSKGFVAHYDAHDVLILQLEGSKLWHLYEGAEVSPSLLRREHKWVPDDGLPEANNILIEAGDTLYVPRGLIHAAEATSGPSVHLTVGIHAPTALTFAAAALNSLSFSDDRLNVRLPPRHLDEPDARAELCRLLRDAARAIEDPRAVSAGLDALAEILVRRGQCPPVGSAASAAAIDGDSFVRRHQPLFSRVVAQADKVVLQFAQLSITAELDHEAAMLFISQSTDPFRVRDLPRLSAPQKVELVRTLIVSGFLVRYPTAADDRTR